MSKDFTGGYGPVEYLIRNAVDGEYQVNIELFSPLAPIEPILVTVEIFTNFGRKTESVSRKNFFVSTIRHCLPVAKVRVQGKFV
jgi:hypothetical protein